MNWHITYGSVCSGIEAADLHDAVLRLPCTKRPGMGYA